MFSSIPISLVPLCEATSHVARAVKGHSGGKGASLFLAQDMRKDRAFPVGRPITLSGYGLKTCDDRTPHPWCPPQAHGSRFLDCVGGICTLGDAEWEGGTMQTKISSSQFWWAYCARTGWSRVFKNLLLLSRWSFSQFENAVESCWALLTLLTCKEGVKVSILCCCDQQVKAQRYLQHREPYS